MPHFPTRLPAGAGSAPVQWRGEDARRAPAGPVRCLLDLDPDLADELDQDTRRVARAAATAAVCHAAPGPLVLEAWLSRAVGGPGVLLLDGVIAEHVRVGGRTAAELLGAGDLIQSTWHAGDELLACEIEWRALVPVRLALLDRGFAKRTRFWPELSQTALRRAGRRAGNLNAQRAIAAQPRLEVRLALMLWHLASRWGRVEPGGVRLALPLTHQLLGQLVSAERPSVSHALARLAQMGLVTGHGHEWHLHGSLEDQLPAMVHEPRGRAEHIVAAVDAGRRVDAG